MTIFVICVGSSLLSKATDVTFMQTCKLTLTIQEQIHIHTHIPKHI